MCRPGQIVSRDPFSDDRAIYQMGISENRDRIHDSTNDTILSIVESPQAVKNAKLPQTVRDKLAKAKRENAKTLNLSRFSSEPLDTIPYEVFDLTQLESLDVVGQNIRTISDRIRQLPNLKRLALQRNPLNSVPDVPGLALDWNTYVRCRGNLSADNIEEIWVDLSKSEPRNAALKFGKGLVEELSQLPLLTRLQVGIYTISQDTIFPKPAGEIAKLIQRLGDFERLKQLAFFGLSLEELPGGLRDLPHLESLSLFGAGLSKIPKWIGGLRTLYTLRLGLNQLETLPESIAHLVRLEALHLNQNPFAEIPPPVFRLNNLVRLDMGCSLNWPKHKGSLKKISAEILDLAKLRHLNIGGHPIEVPPPEVVKEGVDAIKNYWRQRNEVGIDYLCEAKLIIVGEGGAGKTSLVRKIEDPEYLLQPEERSTEGIDVVRWSYPSAVRVKREGREALFQTDFKVNIWDFGGQEIYHATHQFFLTRRSLYILVADDRKEDTDFNYWLQVVQMLSEGSPLLVVQNEKQDRQRDIDLGSLRAFFPNFREAFRVNLATNRGLSDVERAIKRELELLPHIGTPLPKTWSRVRQALEEDQRNHITLTEYFAICQEHGFTRAPDKLQLSGYLHDLGICLHFQNDPVLKSTVILKPKWGTDAVYRVLDDRRVMGNQGRFSPDDLQRIWAEDAYSSMRDELLRLMMKFQLCYQLPDMDAYIAPQLLSPSRPSYAWDNAGGVIVRYEYDFMPKGILTRFIVAENHLIGDENLVWKSGVVLSRGTSRAEVIEDYSRRKITVRVNGENSRGMLAIIDDQLDRIHASFHGLSYDKLLPCNCVVCETREEPFAYLLSELKDFAAQGDRIQCRISRKLVDAAELIRDVFPGAANALNAIHGESADAPQEPLATTKASGPMEVFVSYAWNDQSTEIVDHLEAAFDKQNITFIRDKNDVNYRDSIRDFMQCIGRGKCIVVILSKKYLESKSCMFEMTEIADNGNIRDRVFPIVLDDAQIYDAIGRLRYIKYWEQRKAALDAEMKEVSGENLQGIREELDLFGKIRSTIALLVDTLGDMNTLAPAEHQGTNFGKLLQSLKARLSE